MAMSPTDSAPLSGRDLHATVIDELLAMAMGLQARAATTQGDDRMLLLDLVEQIDRVIGRIRRVVTTTDGATD